MEITSTGVAVNWDGLGWLIMGLFQVAAIWGALQFWKSQTESEIKALQEALHDMKQQILPALKADLLLQSSKTEKVAMIEVDLEALKQQIGVEFKNLREDLRDVARNMHALVSEIARNQSRQEPASRRAVG
jgi:hypothetical protein